MQELYFFKIDSDSIGTLNAIVKVFSNIMKLFMYNGSFLNNLNYNHDFFFKSTQPLCEREASLYYKTMDRANKFDVLPGNNEKIIHDALFFAINFFHIQMPLTLVLLK